MNSPGTILVVDDEPLGRQTLEALLMTQGYQLLFAGNGVEALAQAASIRPDLILLDVMMPEMDGFTVCRRLRADALLAEVPILLVTALDDRDSRLRGIEAGADDIISKPFDRIELRARVQTIVRLNRYGQLLAERMQRESVEAEMVKRNQEFALLQEADRIKNQFVSDVAHELRTPLSIMTLLAGNLDTLYERIDDRKRRVMIRDIREHTRMLNELVDNVLNIARLDSRQTLTERKRVDLSQLAGEEVEKQAPLAHKKAQKLQVSCAERIEVFGDADLLRQVFSNLLNNAIKYTPNGGRIGCECRIRAGSAHAETGWPGSGDLRDGPWAAVRIYDTGIGIAAEALDPIFERFYRVNPQGAIPGTGLGLAIAREIVDLHQGRIAAESASGAGSCFAVYLPLLDPERN